MTRFWISRYSSVGLSAILVGIPGAEPGNTITCIVLSFRVRALTGAPYSHVGSSIAQPGGYGSHKNAGIVPDDVSLDATERRRPLLCLRVPGVRRMGRVRFPR